MTLTGSAFPLTDDRRNALHRELRTIAAGAGFASDAIGPFLERVEREIEHFQQRRSADDGETGAAFAAGLAQHQQPFTEVAAAAAQLFAAIEQLGEQRSEDLGAGIAGQSAAAAGVDLGKLPELRRRAWTRQRGPATLRAALATIADIEAGALEARGPALTRKRGAPTAGYDVLIEHLEGAIFGAYHHGNTVGQLAEMTGWRAYWEPWDKGPFVHLLIEALRAADALPASYKADDNDHQPNVAVIRQIVRRERARGPDLAALDADETGWWREQAEKEEALRLAHLEQKCQPGACPFC